jgi:hypothetical protein
LKVHNAAGDSGQGLSDPVPRRHEP